MSSIEWFESLEVDVAEELKIDFAVGLAKELKLRGMSRSDLARVVQHSPAWITQVMRGDKNLTIETMQQLADAVGTRLHLHLAPKNATVRWFDVHSPLEHTSQAVNIAPQRAPLQRTAERQRFTDPLIFDQLLAHG